jgi:hypothetical protein
MASSALANPLASMSARPTNQPPRAKRLAVERPMPLAAPVMKIARRPSARAFPLAAIGESP